MTTVLLHGFWGSPADWTPVVNRLPLDAALWIPDFYEPGPLAPHHDIRGFCDHFWEEVDERAGSGPVQAVGYSMGGRLLVNLLMQKPKRFSRALVLSGNPLPFERAEWEMEWRNKFLNEPWDDLEKQWNAQEIFSGTSAPRRRHTSMLREMLGQSLINWSPSKAVYQREELFRLPATVEWAFGERDSKYVGFAGELKVLPVQGRVSILPDCGHRLPLDAAAFVSAWVAGH